MLIACFFVVVGLGSLESQPAVGGELSREPSEVKSGTLVVVKIEVKY